MKVIAFIPARCGSKSIPFKNIKDFCGKPLIYWVLKTIEDSKLIDIAYVATDCDEIDNTVKKFQFRKVIVYRREQENASDTSSTEDVMIEFLNKVKFENNDIFVLVQATNPFTTSEDLDSAINQLREEKVNSILSCARIKRFLWNENGTPINYDYRNRPRRQDFKGILIENGAFYINYIGNILKFRNRLTEKIGIYEMPEYTYIELDEEYDWFIAETLMKKYILKPKDIKIKLFICDVDGTLTDGGMYYSQNGDELKKFNTQDGMGFKLLRLAGIKTAIITTENTKIIENRAKKLKVDYIFQGVENKLKVVKSICIKEGVSLNDVAYIGDDINDIEVLENVGLAACPKNAVDKVKEIPNIIHLSKKGGDGAVREFVKIVLSGAI